MRYHSIKLTKEERENILDQHKEIYDGYVTQYISNNKQPLYIQDFANDKGGITVNNKGDVKTYTNMSINEDVYSGSKFEPGNVQYKEEYNEQLDMIGDGEEDLEHGVFDDEENDDFLKDYEEGWEGNPYDYIKHGGFDNDPEFEDLENLEFDDDIDIEDNDIFLEDINKKLKMFRRFKQY